MCPRRVQAVHPAPAAGRPNNPRLRRLVGRCDATAVAGHGSASTPSASWAGRPAGADPGRVPSSGIPELAVRPKQAPPEVGGGRRPPGRSGRWQPGFSPARSCADGWAWSASSASFRRTLKRVRGCGTVWNGRSAAARPAAGCSAPRGAPAVSGPAAVGLQRDVPREVVSGLDRPGPRCHRSRRRAEVRSGPRLVQPASTWGHLAVRQAQWEPARAKQDRNSTRARKAG